MRPIFFGGGWTPGVGHCGTCWLSWHAVGWCGGTHLAPVSSQSLFPTPFSLAHTPSNPPYLPETLGWVEYLCAIGRS